MNKIRQLRIRHAFLVLGYTATFAYGQTASTEPRRLAPIPIEVMLGSRVFGEYMAVDLSPDGKRVAYALRDNRRVETRSGQTHFLRTGASPFASGCDIWIADVESGTNEAITVEEGNNWSPAWSPDGGRIAFYSDRDGGAKVWIWETTTGKLRKVSDRLIRSLRNPIEWSTDGTQLLVKTVPQGMTLEQVETAGLPSDQRAKVGEGASVSVYRSSAPGQATSPAQAWNLGYLYTDLVLLDKEGGGVQTIATRERIAQYWFSPDGTQVLYAKVLGFESAESQQILHDLIVYSVRTQESRTLASGVRLGPDGSGVAWSPDSKWIAFRSQGVSARGECFVVAINGGPPRNVASDVTASGSQAPLWDPSGRYIFFVAGDALWKVSIDSGKSQKLSVVPDRSMDLLRAHSAGQLWTQEGDRFTTVATFSKETKRAGFYRIDLTTGEAVRLWEEDKSLRHPVEYSIAVSTDGQHLVYLAEDTQHNPDLWLSDAKLCNPRRLTYSNPQLESYRMGEGRVISWIGLDGELLHGALLLPAGYEAGKRYPLLVKVYGGSLLSNLVDRFGMQGDLAENLQLLATRGYAVLLPDAPLHVGMPMEDLMKTVLPGVNRVIEMGIADPNRLGLMGHSYGGYSALCLLVETPRFKAAMMSGGFGNLISNYGEMTPAGTNYGVANAEKGQLRMGGPPWEHRERYVENSPVFFLDRVETPLLIVHGAHDGEIDGVAPFLAEEIFVGLRRLGKIVEYTKYEREDHWPGVWLYRDQVDFAARVLAWFDLYLKP